jgi:hypothetical protein
VNRFARTVTELADDDYDPRQRISTIKGAVIDHLRTTDERVKVAVTDHFNHSYVPDLILSWPDEPEPRYVYLRTSFRSSDLLRDIDLLARERPILMPLAPIDGVDDDAVSALESASHDRRTLVTDPYGLEAFGEETVTQPVVSLLSHAILQGGRGLFPSGRARQISGAVGAGFAGAQHADYDATSAALSHPHRRRPATRRPTRSTPKHPQRRRTYALTWHKSGYRSTRRADRVEPSEEPPRTSPCPIPTAPAKCRNVGFRVW